MLHAVSGSTAPGANRISAVISRSCDRTAAASRSREAGLLPLHALRANDVGMVSAVWNPRRHGIMQCSVQELQAIISTCLRPSAGSPTASLDVHRYSLSFQPDDRRRSMKWVLLYSHPYARGVRAATAAYSCCETACSSAGPYSGRSAPTP